MKKLLFFALCLLWNTTAAYSQNMMIVNGDPATLVQMCSGTIKDSVRLDNAFLSAKYRFDRLDKAEHRSDISMSIGPLVMKQTDICLYYDACMWAQQKFDGAIAERRRAAGRASGLFVELLLHRENGKMEVVCGDFFRRDALKCYVQSQPAIEWTPGAKRREIAGYECLEATGEYGGRQWTAYYAPELPLPYGPWKLCGLPGLILAAESDVFSFECIEIRRSEEQIMRYDYGKIQQLRPSDYLRYERNCHEHPYRMFANGENATIVAIDAQKHMVYLDDEWTIPYNPIELE